MERVSVERAAEHLGVSRVQVGRLIDRGDLVASRFGRVWMIDRESLQRYASARPHRGRPLSASHAWQRIVDADPKSLAEVRQLANECRRRADRRPIRLLPGELDAALQDPRLVLGGADAAINAGAAVGQPRERVGYLRESDLDEFLSDHFGSFDNENPNVILRVVDDEAWPFDGQRFAPAVVAAVDLVDVGDVRSVAEVIR
jgi:excisionase family DNA binding protein